MKGMLSRGRFDPAPGIIQMCNVDGVRACNLMHDGFSSVFMLILLLLFLYMAVSYCWHYFVGWTAESIQTAIAECQQQH